MFYGSIVISYLNLFFSGDRHSSHVMLMLKAQNHLMSVSTCEISSDNIMGDKLLLDFGAEFQC